MSLKPQVLHSGYDLFYERTSEGHRDLALSSDTCEEREQSRYDYLSLVRCSARVRHASATEIVLL